MWVYILCFLHSISSSLSLFWDIPNFLPTSRSEETPRRDPEIRGRLGHRHCVAFHIAAGFRPPFETGPGGCRVAPRGMRQQWSNDTKHLKHVKSDKNKSWSMKCFVKMDPKLTSFIVYIIYIQYISLLKCFLPFPDRISKRVEERAKVSEVVSYIFWKISIDASDECGSTQCTIFTYDYPTKKSAICFLYVSESTTSSWKTFPIWLQFRNSSSQCTALLPAASNGVPSTKYPTSAA